LGDRAVTLVEHPSLPRDISYNVYFGLAMLPLTAFLAATLIGAVLTAQEFELHTVVEYRLAPTSPGLILAARLVRLALSSLIAISLLLIAIGLLNGVWPDSLWWVGLILLPVAVIAGCLGIIAGLLLRTTLPAFLVGLVTSFVGWIVSGTFIPAPTIGGWYEFFSRLTPNAFAIQLLFPRYYGTAIGSAPAAALILTLASAGMTALAVVVYRRRVSMQV
jgi:ABC-type multidrug transport system permease subunit